jgi:hypothetical protein
LNGSNRFDVVPPNPLAKGDMGTLWTGDGDPQASPGADIEAIWSQIQRGISLLHPSDVAEIRKLMAEYSGVDPSGPTGLAGVTSLDHQMFATPANRNIAMEQARVQAMQDANDALWNRVHVVNDRAIHGR